MTTEKLVTAIRRNGSILKGMTMRGKGFIQPVVLTLEDGTEVQSTIDTERKKDLDKTFDRKLKSIEAKAFKASFNDKGEFWGTVETMMIGGSGLEPRPDPNNVGMGHEPGGVVDNAIHGIEEE